LLNDSDDFCGEMRSKRLKNERLQMIPIGRFEGIHNNSTVFMGPSGGTHFINQNLRFTNVKLSDIINIKLGV